ncbi:MAG TPA: hypothetical protein VHL53_15940, partial [Acidimicrobiia bacterium]|nr:hypothetical protein [Acidimicrobiia bacterium]
MRMRFGPGDEKGFEKGSRLLLGEFERWLVERRGASPGEAAGVVADASVALDWKWGYGDGNLGSWHPEELAEFLLEWCPRKLSVPPEECDGLPGALQTFLRFLAGSNLLDAGCAPTLLLEDTIDRLAPGYVEAMGDPSKFGMAKSLFTAAAADGIDLTDQAAADGWISDFNARPEEDRRRVLPGPGIAPQRARPVLPPLVLPDEDAVLAAAAEAPVLEMFRRLAGYVGSGRKLTQKGNLTLADARALVELLETGDRVDEQIGDRTFRTRSSADLPRLRHLFVWAKKAGVLRVVHGKVVATKGSAKIDTDPRGWFEKSARALLNAGALSSQRHPDAWLKWPEVDSVLDAVVLPMLTPAYAAQGPVPLEDIVEAATMTVLDAFVFPTQTDEQVGRSVGYDVTWIFDALELAGIVVRAGTEEPDHDWSRFRTGGTVELTDAGVVLVRDLLIESGLDAPAAGSFADRPVVELLQAARNMDPSTLAGELAAWRRRRPDDEAARAVAEAIPDLDVASQFLAFGVLADIPTAISASLVRQLERDPTVRGAARCWLVDLGVEP